jgi:8-amino-7-oxononanoate synthase
MSKFEFLSQELDALDAAGLLRRLGQVDSAQGPVVSFAGGGRKVLFCSNNYLGLANDESVKIAVIKAVEKYGYGSAASRLISGTMRAHVELEEAFAEFFGKEATLMFPSGWSANQAVLTTLPTKGDLVLIDKLDHASIIDGAVQSDAEFHTFRGDNFQRVEKYLADDKYRRKYIVTESVFSMDGICADLKRLVELKNKYGAILIVDEAHSIGCMGKTGAGLAEELGLLDEVDIMIAPLGKAFAANGAIVASKKPVVDYLINKARGFIYTTAPTPVNCAAVMAGLNIIKNQPQRREKLKENADYLGSKLQQAGMDTLSSTTHIIPVMIGDSSKAMEISEQLFERGYFVAAIRPPTVAKGTARLRISLQYGHTKEQIDGLVEAIVSAVA